MATKKPLFNRPAWAASGKKTATTGTSNGRTAEDDALFGRQHIYEDIIALERKAKLEKLEKERRAKEKGDKAKVKAAERRQAAHGHHRPSSPSASTKRRRLSAGDDSIEEMSDHQIAPSRTDTAYTADPEHRPSTRSKPNKEELVAGLEQTVGSKRKPVSAGAKFDTVLVGLGKDDDDDDDDDYDDDDDDDPYLQQLKAKAREKQRLEKLGLLEVDKSIAAEGAASSRPICSGSGSGSGAGNGPSAASRSVALHEKKKEEKEEGEEEEKEEEEEEEEEDQGKKDDKPPSGSASTPPPTIYHPIIMPTPDLTAVPAPSPSPVPLPATPRAPELASEYDDADVSIYINPLIPNTKALIVGRKASQPLEPVKTFWCKKQNMSEAEAARVFLVWRDMKLYNSSTMRHILKRLEKERKPGQKDSEGKIVLEAVTQEIYDLKRTELAAKKERDIAAGGLCSFWSGNETVEGEEGGTPNAATSEPNPPTVACTNKFIIKLVSKEYGELPIRIRPESTVGKIAGGYVHQVVLPQGGRADRTAYLIFDGDRLEYEQTAEEVGLEEGDVVEVQFR